MKVKEVAVFIFIILIFVVGVFSFTKTIKPFAENAFALIYRAFPEKVTPESIKQDYKERPIRILIVPGHDNDYGGTQFNGVTESEFNVKTAKFLYDFLKYNPRFETTTTRDFSAGNYTQVFSKYFLENEENIRQYINDSEIKMNKFIEIGLVEGKQTNNHNFAVDTVRTRLYGINMWANENDIDLVLHIHYNDYPGRKFSKAGEHTGYSIYIPEIQMPNSRVSREIAKSIYSELNTFLSKSTLPMEKDGIIETQELIAIGPNATRDGASVLVEYGYIYEPQLHNRDMRDLFFQEVAYKTYRSIAGHFDQNILEVFPISSLLPYQFERGIKDGERSSEVMRLQAALYEEGFYPPTGENINECPISGYYGNCTSRAVRDFQSKYKNEILSPYGYYVGTGIFGERTLEKINNLMLQKIN